MQQQKDEAICINAAQWCCGDYCLPALRAMSALALVYLSIFIPFFVGHCIVFHGKTHQVEKCSPLFTACYL